MDSKELQEWHNKIYSVWFSYLDYINNNYADHGFLWRDMEKSNLCNKEAAKKWLEDACEGLYEPGFLFHYFTQHVDFYYKNGTKWIRRIGKDINPYDEHDYRNYVRWTKDYVTLYFMEIFWFLTAGDFKKFYRYACEIINWPKDRILDY